MATERTKRLPKVLQDYKKEIKALDFKGKVKAYFDCSPYLDDYGSMKRDIAYNAFSRKEKELFCQKYLPIFSTIDRYGDRLRAINANIYLYNSYIDASLRATASTNYTVDILNRVIPLVSEVIKSTSENDTREKLSEALDTILCYRRVSLSSPLVEYDKKKSQYKVMREDKDKEVMDNIEYLKGIISLLKCYLESLKEFLEWAGTPELFPKEFKNIENSLYSRYKGFELEELNEKTREEFPLWSEKTEVDKALASIDYEKIPLNLDIFGEKNIWVITYRNLFE